MTCFLRKIVLFPVAIVLFGALSFLASAQVDATASGNAGTERPATNADQILASNRLTVERIYAGNEFETKPQRREWHPEGASFRVGENGSLFLVAPMTGEKTLLIDKKFLLPQGRTTPLSPESIVFSDDQKKLLIFTNSRRVWRNNTRGDYCMLDLVTGQLRLLGGAAEEATLMFAKFSPDAKHVAYIRANNIYVESLDTREIRPLTTSGGERFINGTFDWVYEEEFLLTDGFCWSPDGRSIAFWQLDTEGEPVFTMIDHLAKPYPVTRQFKYPRAGETNAAARIGVVSLETGETKWLDIPGDPRNHYITAVHWLPSGQSPPGQMPKDQLLVVQQFNRPQNVMTLFLANAETGKTTPVLSDRDAAWVDLTPVSWLSDGKRFLWQSDHTGWRRLYLSEMLFDSAGFCTVKTIPVSPDDMDVIDFVAFDRLPDGMPKTETGVYFYASPDNATQRYLYRAGLDGGHFKRITPEEMSGTHSYQISPDTTLALHTWSQFGVPPTTEVVQLPSHKHVQTLTDNRELQKRLEQLELGKTELFRIQTTSGQTLDGWAIFPPGYDSNDLTKKYPLIMYVYGEPAGQTVLDRWDGNNYLWHQMLAQKGAVVMSFDNRGTPAPKGREWRKCVSRKIGLIGPQDQAETLQKLLATNPKLDPDRVAIWGWSGGGSSTLHALFQYPDLFKAGIAVAAVPNELNYDTIYQERYMGNPAVDGPENYLKNSPMTYAKNLKGELLIVHGTTDDNCHYQSFEQLVDELVKQGKQFRMMSYPSRTHSIFEREGTTLHLRTMMTRFLEEKLQLTP